MKKPLLLAPMPNGGWVIYIPGRLGQMSDAIGAYSTTFEMIDALDEMLIPPSTEQETNDAE